MVSWLTRILTAISAWMFLAVFASSAPASTVYPVQHVYPTGGQQAGSVAIDQTSGVYYVITSAPSRVEMFNSAGVPILFSAGGNPAKPYIEGNALSGAPGQPFNFYPSLSQVAVDNSAGPHSGYIYVTEFEQEAVDVFDSGGTFRGQINLNAAAPQSGALPCGVAVDSSGEVYVSNYGGHIDKYNPVDQNAGDDEFVGQLSELQHSDNCGLAIDSTGQIYAAGLGGEALYRYEASDLGSVSSPGTLIDPHADSVAASPLSDDVFVDEGDRVAIFSSSGKPVSVFGTGDLSGSLGIAVSGNTGQIYASTSSSVAVFAPTPAPDATTGAVTGLSRTEATVSGTVSPAGNGDITECRFEYGIDTSYGQSAPCEPSPSYPVATEVSASLAGLSSATTYHYRVVATSASATTAGQDRAFATRGDLNAAPGSPFAVGTGPYADAIGDLNGDGNPDVATANLASNDVTVLLGDGSGSFSPAPGSPFAAGDGSGSVAIGDVDGDSDPDLVVVDNRANDVTVLLGDGSGSFSPAPGSPHAVGTSPYPAAIGDVNGDGNIDIAVPGRGSNDVTVLLGDGLGGFEPDPHGPFATGTFPDSVAIGDLDGDGNPDLALADTGDGGITVLLGDGSGGFSPSPNSPVGVGASVGSVVIADLDGDGNLDLVARGVDASTFGHGVVSFLGDGTGGFGPAIQSLMPGFAFPISLAIGDLDGDGIPDAVGPVNFAGDVEVMLGDGSGGFDSAPGSPFAVSGSPIWAAIGDLDQDGKPDLAVTGSGTDSVVSVLLNSYGPPVPLPRASTGAAIEISRTSATLQARVDPHGNGDVTKCSFEYGTSASYEHAHPCSPSIPYSSPTDVSLAISGLSAGETYHYRVVATNDNGVRRGPDRTFTAAGAVAGLSTEAATGIEATSATLNGSFTGEGEDTHYYFEYGTTASYGSTTSEEDAGAGVGTVPVSAQVSGLESNTEYHFRVVAINANGTTRGGDRVLATSARAVLEVSTGPALGVDRTTAFLLGHAYPSVAGDVTECRFEYGTDTSYGQSAPCEPSPPLSSPEVFASLSELTPDTTYHYRVVAANGVETAEGDDETFTTLGPGPRVTTVPTSEFDEISATLNGTVEGTGEQTYVYFEYGTSTSYGRTTFPPPGGDYGVLEESRFVSTGLGDVLRPNTTYHYRIVASNPQGTSHGNDVTFTTPGVDLDGNTGLPSAITATSATVSGDVDPLGGGPITECHFEYGPTIELGQSAPCAPAAPYSSPTVVSAHLTGLQPGTFYYYRVVAANAKNNIKRGSHVLLTLSANNSASEAASAGGTVATNTTTSPGDPTGTSVTTPVAGTVSIAEGPVSGSEPSGYTYSGQQVQITAPAGTVANPLVIHFLIDASLLPPGTDETNLQVFRNGTLVAACLPESGSSAKPNPCVAARNATGGGGVELVIRTSAASTWNFGVRNRPETTIASGPAGPTNDATPTFAFSSSASGSTFQCRIDGEAFRACSGPGAKDTPTSGLADGPHSFEVRATDKAGGTDLSPASASFTVDTHVPETTIDSGPSGTTSNASPTFAFSSDEPKAGLECSLDSGAYGACTSPRALSGLADGAHTFKVRAKDAAGNVDKTPASAGFTVDTVAPETTITSGTFGPTKDSTPTFAFSSSESGSTFQCRVDGEGFRPCSGPGSKDTPASALADGAHGFEVRAVDKAGNIDASAASAGFIVDTHVPETTIDSGPSGPTPDASPTFAFSSDEPEAALECSLDAGAYAACTSPRALSGLADGVHTFKVRAKDGAGNVDATPASAKFTVDTVVPDTTITSGVSGATKNSTPTFAFSSPESGSTFQCRIDGEAFRPCSGPGAKDTPASALGDGAHTFQVRAVDKAGNTDATPASAAFTVDTHVPETTIDSGPSGTTTNASPTFAFSSDEPAATLECSLDSGAYAACTSPRQVGPLAKGAHTFKVRAKDAAGNLDATPATAKFTLK